MHFKVNVSGGLIVTPDYSLQDLVEAIDCGTQNIDFIVLPGGTGVDSNVCSRLKKDQNLRHNLRKLFEKSSEIITICTGSFIIPETMYPENDCASEHPGKEVNGKPIAYI